MYIIPNETKQCDAISCLAETDECAFINHSPQLALGNLVLLDGFPALKGLNMVDTIPRTSPPPQTSTPTRSQPTRMIFFASGTLPPPPHSSDRFRAGRGWLGPHCPRCYLHNTYHFRGRLLVVQIGLRRMFPTSVRNQGTSRDSADSIAPLQT